LIYCIITSSTVWSPSVY